MDADGVFVCFPTIPDVQVRFSILYSFEFGHYQFKATLCKALVYNCMFWMPTKNKQP